MLIATAGHVDHGKTSLIHAITGVDTDRLPAEKSRGLTIDLGFAHLDAGERALSFIDVPGHEKFISNMLAGISVVDAVLLVVAADEGAMPQTLEHLAIIQALELPQLIVALTRVDLVDETELAQVTSSVAALLDESGMTHTRVMPVSSVTGEGVDELVKALTNLVPPDHVEATTRGLRFAVDRVFTVQGQGTVVTGTVIAGRCTETTVLKTVPGNVSLRVRGIQRHGRAVDEVCTGQRAALNVVGGADASLKRGSWLTGAGAISMSARFDIKLKLLHAGKQSLSHWSQLALHIGTDHVAAHLALPGSQSGDDAQFDVSQGVWAQIVVDEPLHVVFGDRFILRDGAHNQTLGGGYVINPSPSANRRARQQRSTLLPLLDTVDHLAAANHLADVALDGIDLEQFRIARNIIDPDFFAQLNLIALHGQHISLERIDRITQSAISALQQWHRDLPHEVGPTAQALRAVLKPDVSYQLWQHIIERWIRDATLVRVTTLLRLPTHSPKLSLEDEALLRQLNSQLSAEQIRPPALKDLAATLDCDRSELGQQLDRIAAAGRLCRIAKNRYFHPTALHQLGKLAESLDGNGFDARAYASASGIGRNLTINVLEYFDRISLTRRIGNTRKLIAPVDTILSQLPVSE